VEYYGYGGDFNDNPNDGHFIMDGLCFSDHTPTPGLTEYRKAIEPVQVLEDSTHEKILIINRYDFATLDHLKCEWSVVGDKFTMTKKEISIPKGVKPGATAALFIPGLKLESLPSESYLDVSFTLKNATAWAKAGHEIAFGQVPIKKAKLSLASLKLTGSQNCPKVAKIDPNILEITGTSKKWQFDIAHGFLSSWQIGSGTPTFQKRLHMDFYRAVTDNERWNDGGDWRGQFMQMAVPHLQSFETCIDNETNIVTITALHRIAPPVLEWSVDTITTYVFSDTGINIHVKGNPRGLRLPHTFARIGLTLTLDESYTKCDWFGRGPGESYVDSKYAQRFGNWSMPVKDLFTVYEYVQEGGNRTDVRWVSFSDKDGKGNIKFNFGDQEGCSFMASHYTTDEIDATEHPYDLARWKRKEVIVRLDWAHQGLGTGSCGPKVLPKYELPVRPFEYELFIE
jgi:beta-galactosidase